MGRITIRVPDELDDEVENQLDYGDTKSEFYRRAAIEKLARDAEDANTAEETLAD